MEKTSNIDVLRKYRDVDPKHILLDEVEAAALLRLKPATLANWRCTGRRQLPYIDLGKVRYRLSDILAYCIENTFHHTGEMEVQKAKEARRRGGAG